MSYSKAVTGWCRAAATFILFFALTAGTAVACRTRPLERIDWDVHVDHPDDLDLPHDVDQIFDGSLRPPLLSVGMSGGDVLALQHDLTALGFTTPATGHFTLPDRAAPEGVPTQVPPVG